MILRLLVKGPCMPGASKPGAEGPGCVFRRSATSIQPEVRERLVLSSRTTGAARKRPKRASPTGQHEGAVAAAAQQDASQCTT